MYDDMCHLAPHAENCKDSTLTTKFFAELPKAVDNFHHKNHLKSDKYCQENTNPKIELQKVGIDKVNSQACEQSFQWINRYKNLKSMNESHFKMFILYLTDLHNLGVEGTVQVVANPLNPVRKTIEAPIVKQVPEHGELAEIMSRMTIENKKVEDISVERNEKNGHFEEFSLEKNGKYCCNFCEGTYAQTGSLITHLEGKHGKNITLKCKKCEKIFRKKEQFTRHLRHGC